MTAAKTGADSARRAIDLLFAFESLPVATVRDLADRLGIPLPSAHRYVAMLRDMGVIEEAEHGRYRLTMRIAALGQAARRATSLIDALQPFMRELAEQTNETVLLVQPIAGLPVCTHRIEAPGRLRLSFEVGQYLPPLRGASAHLLVAALPDEERRRYVDDALARGAVPPVHGVERFLAEVEEGAERGWTVSLEEIDEGVWSAAAMVRSAGEFVGTFSMPCPSFRVTERNSAMLIESVRHAAAQASAALGS